MNARIIALISTLLLFIVIPATVSADVYKFINRSGEVVYTDSPYNRGYKLVIKTPEPVSQPMTVGGTLTPISDAVNTSDSQDRSSKAEAKPVSLNVVLKKCDGAPTTLARSDCRTEYINTNVQFIGVVNDVIDEHHANIDSDDGPYVDVYFTNPVGRLLAKDQRVKITGVLTAYGFAKPDVREASYVGMPPSQAKTSKSPETPAKEKPREPGCWSDIKFCKDNADVRENRGIYGDAVVKCKRAAVQQNGYEIDWGSIFMPNFISYNSGDSALTTGKMWFIDDVAKYQNAFGAKKQAITRCLYNINTKAVDDITIE